MGQATDIVLVIRRMERVVEFAVDEKASKGGINRNRDGGRP